MLLTFLSALRFEKSVPESRYLFRLYEHAGQSGAGAKTCHMSGIGPLHRDQEAVRPGILVKPARHVEVSGQCCAVSGFESCGELV